MFALGVSLLRFHTVRKMLVDVQKVEVCDLMCQSEQRSQVRRRKMWIDHCRNLVNNVLEWREQGGCELS